MLGCGRHRLRVVLIVPVCLRERFSGPRVLTTFTVLADLARNVAGDRLQVHSIVKEGAEIHGYQPTPSDIERSVGADLLVENGLGLELWARRFTAAAGDIPTVTLVGRDGATSHPSRRLRRKAQSPCLDVAEAGYGLCRSSSGCLHQFGP